MPLIHHVVAGKGRPAVVFVHGFGCAHSDWDAQVAHLSPRHLTVAVDLRGHGASPGTAAECSIERYGADVAEVMQALSLPPAVLVGHSMGCRVVVEAALQAPAHAAGIVLIDGSQFASAMETDAQGDVRHPRRLFEPSSAAGSRRCSPGRVTRPWSPPSLNVPSAYLDHSGRSCCST